ncbi:DUF6412 domain-containing protein [Streptomonospora sp. S1-112]|uniref:DUF6412 domain-containing protein n=1 Tax=Streptomonospora mangrovi TaxID=2883123 RepID=A0A9X3NNI1_9ACTN|nr:DUF6412 domain-containing protein [Streptomonospora mangrovi]MDA0567007.1 DUF6412 domain-containing protein [Streptomonospora mangrovi]
MAFVSAIQRAVAAALLLEFDLDWPVGAAGTALGVFAVLAVLAAGAALLLAVVRGAHGRAGADPAEASRHRFLLHLAGRAAAPPVRAPDTPGKPRPRAPGARAAVGCG